MSQDTKDRLKTFTLDTTYTQNRELSWLGFNKRVLEEASDATVPLLERLKFISIFTSNLDEFFMVRVGSLFDLSVIAPDMLNNKTGQTPREQLDNIFSAIPPLMKLRDRLMHRIDISLRDKGIYDLSFDELTKKERKHVNDYFLRFIMPILSPQIVDPWHPFPHLANKQLYIASLLTGKRGGIHLGLVPVPSPLPPLLWLDTPSRFIRVENIIKAYMDSIFNMYTVVSINTISVTRNADLSFDDEKFDDEDTDYRHHMKKLLKKRDHLAPVRLELQGEPNAALLELLCMRLNIDMRQTYSFQCPIDLKYTSGIKDAIHPALRAELTYPPFIPRYPECLDEDKSVTKQVLKRDLIIFYPFEQMTPFIQLLKESCSDPCVISIKITVYRLAPDSMVAHLLCEAAQNGKDVTVLMELRARFDEENNIKWAERLERAGCRITYGIDVYKCHSKVCLITRKARGKVRYITQIGTGNYNEKTASSYTDLCLITSDNEIGVDATLFFQNIVISNLDGSYQKLLVAPFGLKAGILRLIDEEIAKGSNGRITIKANSLTEREIIDKLSEASVAGVRIQLILRGICCLLPGVRGKTENINITSVVGRFLEHSRIYCFGQGENSKIYISSADLMTRNATRRVEVACPVLDADVKRQLMEILDIMLADNVKSRVLNPDGSYKKKSAADETCMDCQKWFMENSIQRPHSTSSADARHSLFYRTREKLSKIFLKRKDYM